MFIRRVARKSTVIGWFIAAFLSTTNPSAHAAQTIHYDSTGPSGCVSAWSAAAIHATKLIAINSVTVNTINVLIGNGTQTNFSTSRYYIMSNNPTGGSPVSSGSPSTLLATFTPDTISGSGVNTIAKYVGTFTTTAGTTYWITPAQTAASFPMCYKSTTAITELVMNSFKVDTATQGSNAGWNRAYSSQSTPIGASWTVYSPDALSWQFSLESNTSEPVVATIGTQSGASKADYRTVTPLTVNVNTQSKVTFYANGKIIAGCRNILSSAGTATCNWRPSVHGSFRIHASANPISNSYVASTTSTISVGVAPRTNKR
jgi:hypothetical protein